MTEEEMADTHSSSNSTYDTSPSSASLRPPCVLVSKEVLSEVSRNFACRTCLSTTLKSTARFSGFDMEWKVTCEACSAVVVMQDFIATRKESEENEAYCLINILLVHISMLKGLGMMGIKSLCWALNFKNFDVNLYAKYVTFVKGILLSGARISCKAAIKSLFASYRNEGIEPDNSGILNIAVSYDEVKHSAGDSTSLVCALTEVNTGFIVDFEVVDKTCETCREKESKLKEMNISMKEYNEWKRMHSRSGDCPLSKAYIKDRSEAVEKMWQRSVEKKLRYTVLVGKTLRDTQILDIMNSNGGPYEDHPVCLQDFQRYIGKKMAAGLLKVREEYENERGCGQLKGKCELSNKDIDVLAALYEKVIRNDQHKDWKSMRKAVLAKYFHCASTDKHPKHMYCESVDCSYVKDQAKNSNPPSHEKLSINFGKDKHLRKKIFDVYTRLTSRKLMTRCLREVWSKNKSWVSRMNKEQQNMNAVEGEFICPGIWAIKNSNKKALQLEEISRSKENATTSSFQSATSPKRINTDLQLNSQPEAKKRRVESDQTVGKEDASTSNMGLPTAAEGDAEEHEFHCGWLDFIPVKREVGEEINDLLAVKKEIEEDITIKHENDESDVTMKVEITDEFYA